MAEEVEFFYSFAELGTRVARLNGRSREAIGDSLEAAAEAVLETMRPMFGEYQPAAGPFPDWPQLADSTLIRRAARGDNPEDQPLKETGDLSESYQVERVGNETRIASDLPYAGVQEEGDGRVPARSTLGRAMYIVENQGVVDFVRDVFIDSLLMGTRFGLVTGDKTRGYARDWSMRSKTNTMDGDE